MLKTAQSVARNITYQKRGFRRWEETRPWIGSCSDIKGHINRKRSVHRSGCKLARDYRPDVRIKGAIRSGRIPPDLQPVPRESMLLGPGADTPKKRNGRKLVCQPWKQLS